MKDQSTIDIDAETGAVTPRTVRPALIAADPPAQGSSLSPLLVLGLVAVGFAAGVMWADGEDVFPPEEISD